MALAAAVLFGASIPASKLLLASFQPYQLAGLLYLGAALAMAPAVVAEGRRLGPVRLDRANAIRLAGLVILGGMVGPVMLLAALRLASAGSVALLLNLEMVATGALGVLLFRDHLSGTGWLGVAGIVGASALLSGAGGWSGLTAGLLVVGACTCWGLDNHFSALIDGMTPARSTFWKGMVAGTANLAIGLAVAPLEATASAIVGAAAVGAVSFGASVALHTAAAQRVGAIRAQGLFASAPFVGAILSSAILREPVTSVYVLAASLFLISAGLLFASQHEHGHRHGVAEHVHVHAHDDGHHVHDHPEAGVTAHTHWHRHEPLRHGHPHWPDLHHRHSH